MMRTMLAGVILWLAAAVSLPVSAQPIDRQALVGRHDVVMDTVDPHAPVMLGNGALGFTADITGLQTFPEAYAAQSPLLTMAQWAWHSHPNPAGWTLADGETDVPVPGRGRQPYAWFDDFALLETRPALRWLRENPHRFSLARIALQLRHADGRPATLAALDATEQRLDLWRGVLVSRFRFDGQPVVVETRVAAGEDTVLVDIRSPLIASGQLAVTIAYPGVGRAINPDPSDWSAPQAHRTELVGAVPGGVLLRRTIDDTVIHAAISAGVGSVTQTGAHAFRIDGQGDRLSAAIGFGAAPFLPAPYDLAAAAADEGWRAYWREGGMIDFAGSTDPRAAELERRVVLSQYLARVNQAGALPPQEEGLFSNSWNGKFHGEMVPWHAAHWAIWGRAGQLQDMLGWYRQHLLQAQARARQHGVAGAWWPKMSGPEGRESPSPINPFIMWQQPHPIFLAELLRRADPSSASGNAALVEETARLLASWPLTAADGRRTLGPPIVPVQENHDPLTTRDPAFELEYYRWALRVAQEWRVRQGRPRDAAWDRTIAGLPAPEQAGGLYLPVAGATDFWSATLGRCRGDATREGCLNRDHPSFLMAYGYIPGPAIDPAAMRRTLAAVNEGWDLRQLWGWDYPMVAMTAARLGDAAGAVDWLFADQANNRWGRTGMTPRNELHAGETGGSAGDEYRRIADTYFPSNGALLLAVGMMAAGWDGSTGTAPGFPQVGWMVRTEGILPLP